MASPTISITTVGLSTRIENNKEILKYVFLFISKSWAWLLHSKNV